MNPKALVVASEHQFLVNVRNTEENISQHGYICNYYFFFVLE